MKRFLIVFLVVLLVQSALWASASADEPVALVTFTQRYAYRLSKFGGTLTDPLIDTLHGAGTNRMGFGTDFTYLIESETLLVKEIIASFWRLDKKLTEKDLLPIYAIVSALEYSDLDEDRIRLSGSTLVKESIKIVNSILDVLEYNMHDLINGESISCFNGKFYNYSLKYKVSDSGKSFIMLIAEYPDNQSQ